MMYMETSDISPVPTTHWYLQNLLQLVALADSRIRSFIIITNADELRVNIKSMAGVLLWYHE